MSDKLEKIGRSVWSLREYLFHEIEMLQEGKTTPQRANAVSKLASQIIDSARVEVLHGKALQKAIDNKALLTDPKGDDLPGVPPVNDPF